MTGTASAAAGLAVPLELAGLVLTAGHLDAAALGENDYDYDEDDG